MEPSFHTWVRQGMGSAMLHSCTWGVLGKAPIPIFEQDKFMIKLKKVMWIAYFSLESDIFNAKSSQTVLIQYVVKA